MKILKKCFRLKSDDNNRVNVNDKFARLEEQEVIYKLLYSRTFFMPFLKITLKITPKELSQIKLLKVYLVTSLLLFGSICRFFVLLLLI